MFDVRNFRNWSNFLKQIRFFFEENKFLEVTTPYLVKAAAFEGVIDTLEVTGSDFKSSLHTSPEIEMKLILSEVKTNIYQISKCFRDDPPSPIHKKEFTMLEFYRVDSTYNDTIQDMKSLLTLLNGRSLPFKEYTVREIWRKVVGVDWYELETIDDMRKATKSLVNSTREDEWDDIFFKVMIDHIEPSMDPIIPVILKDYPKEICALSEIKDGVANKFEIYWKNIELCNGCSELRSIEEFYQRYEVESKKRISRGLSPHPKSETLIKSLADFPVCSGVAVGLDRLFLCLNSA